MLCDRGRNWEVASECPYLTGQIATEYAKGFQTGSDDRFLLGVITLKHWMGYGVETNRTSYDSKISRFDLADSYLPQWKAAVENGRAAGVMCSCASTCSVQQHLLVPGTSKVLKTAGGCRQRAKWGPDVREPQVDGSSAWQIWVQRM